MARTTTPLTNTQVKQSKPTDKRQKLSDGGGLQLWISTNGSKSWMLDYIHPVTKKRLSMSFGIYPAVSLADARKKRAEAKELIANGIDPKEHREDQSRQQKLTNSHTLKTVAADWFEIKKTKVAETTSKSLWRNFDKHLFPKLGHRPIDKLLAPEVINVLKPLAHKGTLETTHKIIGHLNEVMTYAVNTGRIHHNPLSGIRAAFETPKVINMPTLRPEELPELMSKLSYASIKITTRCLLEWQLHTMVRPNEAAATQWSEIDFENELWHVPAERMKMKKLHTVPLTPQTIEILERMKAISGHSEYVFPSDRYPNKPSNSQTANMALKRMGFAGRLVAHGMRALASTTLNEQGFDGDIIEAALAHQEQNEVRRAYNRAEYIERRTVLMCWWSEHIESATIGKTSKVTNIKHLKISRQ